MLENTGGSQCIGVSATIARSSSLCHKSVDLKNWKKSRNFLSGNLLVVQGENERDELRLVFSADCKYYTVQTSWK